jgi:hypothetical protein
MLEIQKNWTREKEVNESNNTDLSQYKELMTDYQDQLQDFPREFKGETYKAKIICALEKTISYQRDGKQYNNRVLEVTFLLRCPEDNRLYYHNESIFIDEGRQSNTLHDFLMLCTAQKPNALADAFEHLRFGKVVTYYPNICGCLFVLNIATSGYNKKGYQQYKFRFYALDNRTQEEIELGKQEALQFYNDKSWLEGVFKKHLEKQNAPQTQQTQTQTYGNASASPAPAQQQTAIQQRVNSFTGTTQNAPLDDDLPF